jgi:pimeloyl-ACP methyl ester carboxylesterase
VGRNHAARIHAAVDGAVRWRLGALRYETDVSLGAESPAPDPFWAGSRVATPAPVRATGRWRHRHGRELRLEGVSDGPGTHPGSARLIATAQLADGLPDGAPLVLIVHGYAVPVPFWDVLQARAFRRAGAHTVLIDLPFHLRRRVPGRRSGDGFFSADPSRILATIRQSVEDASALVAWARREVTPTVGVVGVSLGGLVGSLLAAQVPLDAAMLVAPLCDAPSTFMQFLPSNAQRRLGITGDRGGRWGDDRASARIRLDAALGPIVPRNLVPVTEPSRITMVRPLHDIIVGAEPVAELARAWGVEVWDYPYGHITVMNAPGIGARMRQRVMTTLLGRPEEDGQLFSDR